jgi:hypothetical protein
VQRWPVSKRVNGSRTPDDDPTLIEIEAGVAASNQILAANIFSRVTACNRSQGLKTYGFPDQPNQLGLQKRLSQKGKAAPIRIAS